MTERGSEAETLRTRIALGALTSGVGGALTYAVLRAWVHLRGGGGGMALILRQQTVAYFQALGVSAFVGVALGVGLIALTEEPDELKRVERLLAAAAAPAILFAGALYYWLP